jgi:acetyl-CoA C-acetyltransferase
MAVDPRTPCLIGVAQSTWRPDSPDLVDGRAPEPLVMWEQVARAAAADARTSGGVDRLLGALDSIQVVYCQSWQYDDAPGRLGLALGAEPKHRLYSGIGGTTPQQLVDSTAESILNGEFDLALVCGAEALATKRRLKKAGEKPAWSHRETDPRSFPFEAPFHSAEIAHDVFQAWLTFPLWDVARRAHDGIAPEAYAAEVGATMAGLSTVAEANPLAWFPRARSAAELAGATAENRLVAYPYTKYEVSVMDVDMAGALLVASHAQADALGVPAERRVYLRGWCFATDPTYVAEHPEPWRSPAMAAASTEALRRAGVGIDDVAHLDLYSCFASSVHLACDALGVAPDDGRALTVTGGLPYFGGPGSNYVTHAIAAMAERLRADPGSVGLVSGVGMHRTKHVFAAYSTTPPADVVEPGDADGVQTRLAGTAACTITDRATGPARVVTYTVVHGRDGGAEWGLAVCDLPDRTRCYAKVLDADLLATMEAQEWVGTEVTLVDGGKGVNLVQA